MSRSDSYDVVVIGSGCAGMATALSAAIGGAKVLVVESAKTIGGTTAISGGGMWLPCNAMAKEQGYEDSPEDVRIYLNRLAVGKTTPALIDAFIENAPKAFDMLAACGRPLELAAIPDYKNDMPGSRAAGRVIWAGLYESRWLGNKAALVRDTPEPGGMPPLMFVELNAVTWGMDARNRDWAKTVKQRRADGVLGEGRALAAILFEACLSKGVAFELETKFTSLVQDGDGRITGARVEHQGKSEVRNASRGVMLASGGFEWNRQMWNDLVGVPLDLPISPPENDGAALRAAARVGARIGNTREIWWMPALEVPGETYDGQKRLRMGASGKSLPGAIVVNKTGRRFANESMNYNDFGQYQTWFDPQKYEFPNYPSYVICDSAHRESYMPVAYDGDHHDGAAWLISANTIGELADKLGVDRAGLEKQVAEFNEDAENGVDRAFARGGLVYERSGKFGDPNRKNANLAPLTKAPFYGYRLHVSCIGTKGGPVINDKSQVMSHDGKIIPGLYAAGNAASAVFGSAYPGGGSTLGAALTFGYIAGRTMTNGA